MDPFTESLLERTRARSENLAKKMNKVSPRKRRTPLAESNYAENEEKKVRREASPVKSAVQRCEVKADTPAVPSIRSRIHKLADMRKEWDADGTELDSPQNVPAPRAREIELEPVVSVPSSRKGRFAALAASINSWEDDLDHPKHDVHKEEKRPTRKWERPKPVEEPIQTQPSPKKSYKSQYVKTEVPVVSQELTPKKPARNVRFQEEEEEEKEEEKTVIGNGQGKAQMRSLPAGSPKKQAPIGSKIGSKIGNQGGKAELRSLQSSSPVKSAASRLGVSNAPVKRDHAELRSVSASPARKRIQVSMSREREPSRSDFQKLCHQQHQPLPKAREAPTTTQYKPPTRQFASQPIEAPKKQVNEAPKKQATGSVANGKGVADVKAYFGKRQGNGAVPSSPKKVEARVGAMAKSIQDRLKQHQENWHGNDINTKIQEQRKKELDVIKNRWNHSDKKTDEDSQPERAQPTPKPRVTITASVPEPESSLMDDSREDQDEMEVTEDTINVGMVESPPPAISSSEDEEEEEQVFVPRVEVKTMTAIKEEEKGPATPQPPPRPRRTSSKLLAEEEAKAAQAALSIKNPLPKPEEDDDSEYDSEDDDEDICDVLGDIDDLLNEAEQAMEEEQTPEKIPQKMAQTAAVPEQKKTQVTTTAQKPPTGGLTRSKPGTSGSPNLYSIESFRKHGPKSPSTTVTKSIIRSESGSVGAGQGVKPIALKPVLVKEQIQTLMEEVSAQQSIIYQTSQALNLIASNPEHKGTTQEVEAERLLLIAAQRRQACLAEIQRLKTTSPARGVDTMQTSDGEVMKACKGFVTLQDLRLPLKTEYVLSSKQDRMCHYYFLLLRCREHVLATHIQTTVDGLSGDCLPFTNIAKFNNLDSDFVVEVFVFEMQIKRPKPADEKTKQNFFSGLTPKKILANMSKETRQSTKIVSNPSPGGPGSVRASNFTLVGATRLSLQSFRVSRFTLSKVPFNSPLEGTVHMSMSCHTNTNVSESGFLTMFDDISGFGAWHRRWCTLSGGYISFWKYPDDENHKAPIGTIDLRQCVTNEVAPISRILCARPNTFELVTRQKETHSKNHRKDTLVTKHEDSGVTTKHMLSADVKEDRLRWIHSLNKTLLDLRTWNREAARPTPTPSS
ncbi:anillin-like [Asterias rubens]|uniref:anillin-like n=1 Tax=Asterias rubens TaxID=7604 RepID=UPI00145576B4|nr:anillin-like [Asterias rubens]